MTTPGCDRSQRLTRTVFDWRMMNRIIEMPMPTRTAYCSAISMVKTNVTVITTAWIGTDPPDGDHLVGAHRPDSRP